MQQDCLLICDELADDLRVLHLFHQGVLVDVEVWPVGTSEVLIFSHFLELVVVEGAVADGNAALALPPILHFHSSLPLDVPDLLPLQVQFHKVALQIYRYGPISFAGGPTVQQDVGDQVDPATQ